MRQHPSEGSVIPRKTEEPPSARLATSDALFSHPQWVYDTLGQQAWALYQTEGEALRVETPYQRAEIHRHPEFGKMLFLDGELQSASRDEFIYHETIVHPALLTHPAPRRVAILGGGEGGTAREVLRHPGVESVVMVDIDRAVVDLSQRYLPEYSCGSFSDPRLQTLIGDARVWLSETSQRFDVILSDLTEPGEEGPSLGLFQESFFALMKSRLSDQGVLALQASHGNLGHLERHCQIRRRLDSVFALCRSMVCHIPSFGCHWAFAVASKAADPAALSPSEVDQALAERKVNGLRFYDGITHRRLFSLPRYFRQALAESSRR